ncbi:MAG: AbrB/MazE/SpoVT family DNA-binding domain-containing protein [Pseudomonadota bacterium]
MDTHKTIKKIGNSAFLPLSQDILQELKADVGSTLRVSVSEGQFTAQVEDSHYDETWRAADRMASRYARTLRLFGQ